MHTCCFESRTTSFPADPKSYAAKISPGLYSLQPLCPMPPSFSLSQVLAQMAFRACGSSVFIRRLEKLCILIDFYDFTSYKDTFKVI